MFDDQRAKKALRFAAMTQPGRLHILGAVHGLFMSRPQLETKENGELWIMVDMTDPSWLYYLELLGLSYETTLDDILGDPNNDRIDL